MHLLINVNIFQQRKIFLFPKKEEEKKSNKRQPKVLFNIFTTRNEKGVQSCRKAKKYYERFSKNEVIRFFFLSGFCFTSIHESQDCKGRGRAFHQLLTTTSTRFTGTQTLAGGLLRGAHLCVQLAAGLEPGTFGFRAQVANH